MPRKPIKGDVAADEAVYGAIRRAMHMGRLAPGTKLQEPALARVLGLPRDDDMTLGMSWAEAQRVGSGR